MIRDCFCFQYEIAKKQGLIIDYWFEELQSGELIVHIDFKYVMRYCPLVILNIEDL